jgi:hypothetical protein
MPRNRKRGNGRRKKGGSSKAGAGSVDSLIVRSNRASALTVTVPEDLTSMPKGWIFNQRPPRNFLSQIHWVQLTADSLVSTNTATPTETNQSVQLSNFNGYSAYTGGFDQYACYCYTVTVSPWSNISAANNMQVWTAIDYDNASAVGVSGIEAFGSCNLSMLAPNGSIERYVRPCVDPSLYNGGYGAGRFWVDSGSPSVQHYGVRVILGPTTGGSTVEISLRALFAFRNNI